MIYSHSSKAVAQDCLKKYQHKYVRKVYPRKRPLFFVVGSAVHAFLDVYYQTRGQQLEAGTNAALSVFEKVDKSLLNAEDLHDLAVQEAMVLGICKAYPEFYAALDFTTYVDFMVEQRASMLLTSVDIATSVPGGQATRTERIEYEGIMDLLAKDAAGDWWVIDTKTTAMVTEDYLRRVQIDDQVTGYCMLAHKLLGKYPKGVVYNVIKKPAIRLKQSETKQAFTQRVYQEYVFYGQTKSMFQRHEVLIGEPQLKRWRSNTIDVLQDLTTRRLTPQAKWPMNTGACLGKFSTCEYFEACVAGNYNRMLYEKGADK